MKKYILSILAAAMLGGLTVSAVPAKRVPYKVTQPDGTTVMLVKSGDERFHLIQTLDNYPVVRNAAGYYCFATIDASGNVAASDLHAAPLERLDAVSLTRVKALDAKAVRSALRLKADTKNDTDQICECRAASRAERSRTDGRLLPRPQRADRSRDTRPI